MGFSLGLYSWFASPHQHSVVFYHELTCHCLIPVGHGRYDYNPQSSQRHCTLQSVRNCCKLKSNAFSKTYLEVHSCAICLTIFPLYNIWSCCDSVSAGWFSQVIFHNLSDHRQQKMKHSLWIALMKSGHLKSKMSTSDRDIHCPDGHF